MKQSWGMTLEEVPFIIIVVVAAVYFIVNIYDRAEKKDVYCMVACVSWLIASDRINFEFVPLQIHNAFKI